MRHLSRSPVGRALVFAAGIIILATSCARGQQQQPPASEASATQQDLIVQVASYDLAVGEETRVIVGLLTPDQEFVTHGTVALRLAFLGTKDETAQTPKYGSPLEGVFLAIPGETVEALAEGPVAGPASKGRGVYAVRAKFDRPGFWRAEVTADIRGDRKRGASRFWKITRFRHQAMRRCGRKTTPLPRKTSPVTPSTQEPEAERFPTLSFTTRRSLRP